MTTALIDFAGGNLHSAQKAFERMAAETGAGPIVLTSDPEVVRRAERVVLPGDGAFPACRAELFGHTGLADALQEVVTAGRPFLGICVGMQLLASVGHEYAETPGFGWIPGHIRRIAPADPALKVPHMGWNDLVLTGGGHPVLDGLATGDHAYFVHSYQMHVTDPAHRLAHVDYGGEVTAIVGRDTIVGTQFHPEKSQAAGLRLIANFLNWRP